MFCPVQREAEREVVMWRGEEARSVKDVEKAEGTSLHRQSQQRGLSALAGLGGAQMPGYVAPSPAGSPGLLESPFAVE